MNKRRVFFIILLIVNILTLILFSGCSTKNLLRTEKVGSIFVSSDIAGAEILLDNIDTHQQTPDTLFNVKVGSHQVKVEMEGYWSSPRSIIVEVQADTTIGVSFNLLSLSFGSLRVSSNVDSACIAIDNLSTDRKTPYLFVHNIPAGTRIISIYKEGYSNDSPAKEVVNISTADTVSLTFNLTPATTGQNVGDITPDFYLQDDYGEWYRLYAYRGFVCMVNFWAVSCPNCMAELPYLQQIYQEYSPDSLKLFALNYDDGFDIISQKRNELGLTFGLLRDAGGSVKSEYELLGTPVTIIIDRSGDIYYYKLGFEETKAEQIMNEFRQKLNELFGK
jgi:peroxiredoxin